MKELILTKETADSVSHMLERAGYTGTPKEVCISFSKGRGDKTYLHHSLNIIRATKNTVAEEIIISVFSNPNGRASESQDDKYSTWFFNGYSGKAGSKTY